MIDELIATAESADTRCGGTPKGLKPHGYPITLRHGMDDVQTLYALAHELGHAHYDDPPGHFGAHELRADRFAAKLLINPDDYRLLETTFGPHPARLAHELGVTVNVLKTWQTLHESKIAL